MYGSVSRRWKGRDDAYQERVMSLKGMTTYANPNLT